MILHFYFVMLKLKEENRISKTWQSEIDVLQQTFTNTISNISKILAATIQTNNHSPNNMSHTLMIYCLFRLYFCNFILKSWRKYNLLRSSDGLVSINSNYSMSLDVHNIYIEWDYYPPHLASWIVVSYFYFWKLCWRCWLNLVLSMTSSSDSAFGMDMIKRMLQTGHPTMLSWLSKFVERSMGLKVFLFICLSLKYDAKESQGMQGSISSWIAYSRIYRCKMT